MDGYAQSADKARYGLRQASGEADRKYQGDVYKRQAWIISQRGHAVANGLPVVSVNRVGHEPDPSMQTNGISVSYTHLDVYKRQSHQYDKC